MKHCPRCETDRPAEEFGRNAAKDDGLAVYCRDCVGAYRREWLSRQAPGYMESRRAKYEAMHPQRKRIAKPKNID